MRIIRAYTPIYHYSWFRNRAINSGRSLLQKYADDLLLRVYSTLLIICKTYQITLHERHSISKYPKNKYKNRGNACPESPVSVNYHWSICHSINEYYVPFSAAIATDLARLLRLLLVIYLIF